MGCSSSYCKYVTVTLYNVQPDVPGTITPGGPSVTVTTTSPNQNAALTFSGTAGQRVSLQTTNGTYGVCGLYLSLLNPNGSVLVPTTCMDASGFIDTTTLPTTGTYTIKLDPQGLVTGSATVTLYNVPPDVTGTVRSGGPSVAVTISTPGQNGSLTFSGKSGKQTTVRITSNTMGTVTVKLLKPDGTVLTSTTSSSSSFNLATQTLPTNGTYTISIDPSGANTGSMNVSVTSP